MRAAVLRESGTPLSIEDVELLPPGRGEILVDVEAAGVCHSDLHYMRGELSCPLPAVLGHEGAGRVAAVGEGVTSVAPGDRVALMWRPNCGSCPPCRRGNPVMCVFGPVQAQGGGLLDGPGRLRQGSERMNHFLGVSCFAEQVVVPERSVVKVRDSIPAAVAAIAGCAVVTGVGAVTNVVGACAGDSLVVVGAGGVGLAAVMGAKLAGASPIIAIDLDPRKLDLAQRFGATHVVDARADEVIALVHAIVPGGVDWVIEAVGRPATLRDGLGMLAPEGTLVAVGLGSAGQTFDVPINDLVQRQKRIVGSLYGSSNPHIDIPRILGLYESGRLPLDDLIGRRYPLGEVNEAFDGLRDGAVGRAIIVPTQEDRSS